MSAGQQPFAGGYADPSAVAAVEDRLEALELARHAGHAALLGAAAQLHRLNVAAGMELSSSAQLAWVWCCSEDRAAGLLGDALLLAELPGALDAIGSGVLRVEGSRVVVELLLPLPEELRLVVWGRLHARLLADADDGVVRPPARLRELLRRLVITADPAAAVARRRAAEADAQVDYRRRADGLVDLYALGLTGPNAHACPDGGRRGGRPDRPGR